MIVTRGHTHDLDALRALTASPLRYLGLIGSKAKVRRIFDALLRKALRADSLAGRARADRARHRRHHPAGNRRQHRRRADRREARQDREPNVAAVSMRWEGALRR